MHLKIATLLLNIHFCAFALAQGGMAIVSFDYEAATLGMVINDLENRYDLGFIYSPSQLPLEYELTAKTIDEDLAPAIKRLFKGTPIKYAFISDQIALRADRGMLAQLETKKPAPKQSSPIYGHSRSTLPSVSTIPIRQSEQVTQNNQSDLSKMSTEDLGDLAAMTEDYERQKARQEYKETHRLAQISLLPYLGTNTYRSNQVTNRISLNIFWGTSYAIDGFEVGGVANSVVEDVKGFQFAGGVNQVGGKMTGTQIAGLINHVDGLVDGLQLAFAGGNIGLDSVKGTQIGLVFNVANFHMDGAQYAGVFNWTEGNVKGQKALLLNRAKRIEKRQIGLFNFCDTSARTPIGLLSFVKQGHKRIDFGGSEEQFIQLGAKIGTHHFYNIIVLGLRWDHLERQFDGRTINGNFNTWSLGYGLGMTHRLSPKSMLNTELTISKVNEFENWTKEMNLWGQFKLTYDFQPKKGLSFYAGPTFNMMWSELYNDFSGEYGSIIAPRSLWNDQNGKVNFKGWIGFTAGLRI